MMSGHTSTEPPKHKKPYEKPVLRTIDLVAEEVLAVGCKLADAGGGPFGLTCLSSSCFNAGS